MFGDFATIPMVVFTYVMCILLERLSLAGGSYFKIWKIDPNIEFKDKGADDLDKDFFNLLMRISEFQQEEDLIQED
jgi:hypothetical protein